MSADKVGSCPAFPVSSINETQCTGISIRDYFAAKALQGYLASMSADFEPVEFSSTIAKNAYFIADAMIAARAA